MADIFETIWQHPASHVSVSKHDPGVGNTSTNVDILLNEVPAHGGNCIDQDNATGPLFARVNETLFTESSFATFIALLDNYTAVEGREERPLSDPAHRLEVDAFLDAILPTEPMQLAFAHVQEHLRPNINADEFRDLVRTIWFEPFTNNFSGPDPHCVGFEHVFVGEDGSSVQSAPACADKVGGYHSWIKFYLDEQAGKANYLGHDYRTNVLDDALADYHVATVIMTWRPTTAEGGHGHTLLKKPGGFFVGTRPECEIALGTVGLLAGLEGQFDNRPTDGSENHRRVKLGNSFFDLVLHPHTIEKGSGGRPSILGEHLRTLYPKFRGSQPDDTDGGAQGEDVVVTPTQPFNNGPIRIARALPNPPGPTDQGEWVELENVSSVTFDLSEWQLTDGEGRPQVMIGPLAPGMTRRIEITRADQQSMMLSNRRGWIVLFEGNVRRAAVQYSNADQEEIFVFG